MSQYQQYQQPIPGSQPQNSQYQQYSANSYQAQSPPPQHSYNNGNSYPSQSTYPPQSYNSPKMEQPQATYQAPQQMSEKPQAQAAVQAHSHPKNGFGNKWLFGLFDCCSPMDTCCLGFWCSCFLFGKTYAREHGEGETSGCSGMCCLWYLSASFGVNSCLQCIMRGQQRERHGIEGSAFGDFCASFWCPCCTLMQEEKESVVRNTGIDPKTKIEYQPINQNMNYPA